jgi:hypothetical protein
MYGEKPALLLVLYVPIATVCCMFPSLDRVRPFEELFALRWSAVCLYNDCAVPHAAQVSNSSDSCSLYCCELHQQYNVILPFSTIPPTIFSLYLRTIVDFRNQFGLSVWNSLLQQYVSYTAVRTLVRFRLAGLTRCLASPAPACGCGLGGGGGRGTP